MIFHENHLLAGSLKDVRGDTDVGEFDAIRVAIGKLLIKLAIISHGKTCDTF